MLAELSVDRFSFACRRCGHEWTLDYLRRHVDDGHGWSSDCYFRNGGWITAPTAPGVVCCPRCEGQSVRVQHVLTREEPQAHDGAPPPE